MNILFIFRYSVIFLFNIFLIGISCNEPSKPNNFPVNKKNIAVSNVNAGSDSIYRKLENGGLVDIQKLDTTILVDLKYATTDNFTGVNLYGSLTKAYLQPEIAQMLVKSSVYLRQKMPGSRLLVWDAARPRAIQYKLWDVVHKKFPNPTDYVANPKRGSVHNFGCAVDLTIIGKNGKPLDMGTPFDYFEEEAWPKKEDSLMAVGKLSFEQVKNRRFLRRVMYHSGFTALDSEWWHFNGCSFNDAQKKYKMVE